MSHIASTIKELIPNARAAGIDIKESTLRDALSYALVGIPYNKAVFSEREGKEVRIEFQSELIQQSASKFDLDAAALISLVEQAIARPLEKRESET